MNNKLVSIIIPAYNVENYISRCLDSVILQSYQNIEILVINDGSTDNTLSIIESYRVRDRRISLINQKNKGLSAARNVGLDVSQGDYIYFVDGDDFISEKTIELLVYFSGKNNLDITEGKTIHYYGKNHPVTCPQSRNRGDNIILLDQRPPPPG
jgi:glycosyltransferase involved in cell wall biosynthesis